MLEILAFLAIDKTPRRELKRIQAKKDSLAPLVEPLPAEISLETLPKKQQTIRLRFETLKRKVCKPYDCREK